MSGQGIHHRRVVQRVVFHLASLGLMLVLAAVAILEAGVHSHIIVVRRLSSSLSLDTLAVSLVAAAASVLLGAGLMLSLLSLSMKLGLDILLLRRGVSVSLLGRGRMHTSSRGGHAGDNGNGNRGGALAGGTRDNRGRNRGDTGTGSSRLRDRSRAGWGPTLTRVSLLLGPATSGSRPPGDWVQSGIHPPVGVGGGGCGAALGLMLGTAKALEVLSAVGMLAHGFFECLYRGQRKPIEACHGDIGEVSDQWGT